MPSGDLAHFACSVMEILQEFVPREPLYLRLELLCLSKKQNGPQAGINHVPILAQVSIQSEKNGQIIFFRLCQSGRDRRDKYRLN